MLQTFFREHLLWLFCFIFVFFFFQQQDLDFTARVSMNLYSINPLHLYDEAAKYAYVGPPGNINYLPSTYLLFALWGLPLKILGLISDPSQDTGYAIFWYKVLPTIFFFACAVILQKISEIFLKDELASKKIACLWMVSPFAFFSQFVFGQYDSFTLFFTLLGIYFYFQKDLFKFSFLFGIALTFKYFPLFVYFPMLFLIEKDIKAIFKNAILFALPIACVAGPFLLTHSPEFKLGVLGFGAANRVSAIVVYNGITSFNLILMLFGVLCGYLYFFETVENDWKERALKYGGLGVMILFFFICWHPQWLLFLSPFMLLNLMYRKHFKDYLLFQMLLTVVTMACTTLIFELNVDQNLLILGLLGKWFPRIWQDAGIVKMNGFFMPHSISTWLGLFNALLVLGMVFTYRNFKKGTETVTRADLEEHQALINVYTAVSVGLFPLLAFAAYFIMIFRWISTHP